MTVWVLAWLVAGIPAIGYAQEGPKGEVQESAQEQQEEDGESENEGSVVEDAALATTSVAVSAGQIPLRAGTCAATVIVAGLAYLLTVFDREARQGPGDAISRVCGGPYTTSPDDLRGR
jgi:hypothetical protein